MTVEHNKEFFNNMATEWDEITNHNPEKINYLIEKLNLKFGKKVLDVGTGTGILLPFLYKKIGDRGEITAIDLAEKMLKQAKLKYPYPNIKYVEGDVTQVSLPHAFFDKIVCYSVFPHFVDPFKTLTSLRKYLKVDGTLLICHSESREKINQRHDSISENLISRKLPLVDDLKQLVITAGFKVIETEDNENFYFLKGIAK